MKEYLLKQPKATCVLFSIACKINLGLVKNNGNPGGRGGLWPWKYGWEGGSQRSRKSGWEGGVKKPCHPPGDVDFFWNNPISTISENARDITVKPDVLFRATLQTSAAMLVF